MERKKFMKIFALAALTPTVFIAACQNGEKKAEVTNRKQQMYTCSMHPQVIKDKPGSCPICGMELVRVQKTAGAGLTLNERQQALANITTTIIGINDISGYKQLNGRLAVNPDKTESISSRVPGRIEQLYVRETGVNVKKGQPLYQIYSEQLATLQKEYMMALEQVRQFPEDATFKQLLQAGRQKLELYDQSQRQITQLAKNKKNDPYITYYAQESGVVAELSVTQGQYVSEGSPILRLEGYSSLWVEADLYPSEASSVKEGQSVKVVISGWENQPQIMTVSFIAPSLQSGSQVLQLRGKIPNPGNQWQPGLQATVFLPTSEKGKALSLPVDAVIRTGNGMPHVWIETGKGKFEPRMVKLGAEGLNLVEIKEGLKKGDTVVVTGAYLLYSESILKKGKDPMAGMKM